MVTKKILSAHQIDATHKKVKKQKTGTRNPFYRGDSRWTANRDRKKREALAKSAKGTKELTSYFSVS